jgi:two-component system NtrC family sensor kinase
LLKRRIESREILVLQQLKWISYGTLAGFLPFSLIYIIPTLLGARESFAMDASMLFLGFIPLSMGYALVRYRLFDVEVIVRRGAAYFISSALLLAVYLLFVLVLSRVLQWIAPQANFMAICLAALVIALLFAPLRNAVQLRLDRLFYRDQFEDRATLLDFARTLGSEISLAPLSRSILERIAKTFQIDKAAIFLSNPAHAGVFRLADSLYSDALSADHLYPRDELIDRDSPGNPIGLKSGATHLYRTSPVLMKSGFLSLQDLRLHGKQVE